MTNTSGYILPHCSIYKYIDPAWQTLRPLKLAAIVLIHTNCVILSCLCDGKMCKVLCEAIVARRPSQSIIRQLTGPLYFASNHNPIGRCLKLSDFNCRSSTVNLPLCLSLATIQANLEKRRIKPRCSFIRAFSLAPFSYCFRFLLLSSSPLLFITIRSFLSHSTFEE